MLIQRVDEPWSATIPTVPETVAPLAGAVIVTADCAKAGLRTSASRKKIETVKKTVRTRPSNQDLGSTALRFLPPPKMSATNGQHTECCSEVSQTSTGG